MPGVSGKGLGVRGGRKHLGSLHGGSPGSHLPGGGLAPVTPENFALHFLFWSMDPPTLSVTSQHSKGHVGGWEFRPLPVGRGKETPQGREPRRPPPGSGPCRSPHRSSPGDLES